MSPSELEVSRSDVPRAEAAVDPEFDAARALGLEALAPGPRAAAAAGELRARRAAARRAFVERRLIALHPERRARLAGARGLDVSGLLSAPAGVWLALCAERELGAFGEPTAAWIDRDAQGMLCARGARLLGASLAGAPASVRARAAASVGPEYAELVSGGGTLVALGPGLDAERKRAQALVARAGELLAGHAAASPADRLLALGLLALAHGVGPEAARLSEGDWRALRWRLPSWVDALWPALRGGARA